MRIGLFTESFDPIINGVSTSVKTLAEELLNRGHEPVIVAPRYPGFRDDGPLPVIRVPSVRTIFAPTYPVVPPPIGPPLAVLRGERFDLVHTQQPFGLGMHGRRCAERLGVPLVSTNHTLYSEYTHYVPIFPRRGSQAILSRILRRYYNRCDSVVVPSRSAGSVLASQGVTTPSCVVPTGVRDASPVPPGAVEFFRTKLSLPEDAPVLLYVGRLAREKNLDLLIDSFARLLRQAAGGDTVARRDPVLLLVGSGPYLETLRRRVRRLGIDSRVRFAGFIPRQELAGIYAAATLFVFPSGTETQGVVLSEAQSYGLPCVVVDAGGAPEFVRKDVDALVVPADLHAFTAAVECLLQDGSRRIAMADSARQSPLRPTPDDMVREIIRIYEKTLSLRGGG